jgi:uncharacterized protein (DUF433 family)
MNIDPRRYSDRREVPKYSITEAALYLRLRPRTLHTWFFGRSYHVKDELRFWLPLAIPAEHDPHGPSLSFYNLAEAHVLSATRGFKIRPVRIRLAMDTLVKMYPTIEHPLISREFETDGKDIFIRTLEGEGVLVNLSAGGQLGLGPILNAYLKRIDRDLAGWPLRVYPVRESVGEAKRIVIIPTVASGRPTIAGTGVRVETIWNRAQNGETPEDLADDYGIDTVAIKEAISYFADVKAA